MFQLLARLVWPFLPFALVAGAGLMSIVSVVMLFDEHPTKPTVTAIAEIAAGNDVSKWCTFNDGVLDWGNMKVYEKLKHAEVQSTTYYVPYSSQDAAKGWSLKQAGSGSGSLLVVEFSQAQMREAFPHIIRGSPKDLYTPHTVTGKITTNPFDMPNEMEGAMKEAGFERLVVMQLGKRPASLGSEISVLIMLLGITALGLWWIVARLDGGSWHGLNF